MKYFFAALLLLVSLSGFTAEQNPLIQKLINGSPWVFTTKYENTVMRFRLTAEGDFQRQGTDGEWKSMPLSESGNISWQTVKGHQISIQLNEAGEPVTVHSKHDSTFKSQNKNP